MMKHRTARRHNRTRSTPGAFTLVEVLVALGVMMLLLVIILIPVNMGLDLFHIGKARSEVTQANQLVLTQLASELRRAVYVFPNEEMPGITNKPGSPYLNNSRKPYFGTAATDNTSRIDFLLPAVTANGSIRTPIQANNYLVTYYARRLKPKMDDNVTDNPYNDFSNPIVLWRAQYTYIADDGTPGQANLDSSRYPTSGAVAPWLTQSPLNEPNLKGMSEYTAVKATRASHTQLMPNDMALVTSNPGTSLQPDSLFTCDDSNNDGKIDRVTISLLMAKYDAIGAGGVESNGTPRNQQIRLTRTVELPNVK